MKAGLESTTIPNLAAVKAFQKAMWESGDFGQIARRNETVAEAFMARQPLQRGSRVLDVACGTGNLALIAARRGCVVSGVDIARNLLVQARARADAEGLRIDFKEGDAEELPFADGQFDHVVSMFGVMFALRPGMVAAELRRVTRPGGRVALANWTPQSFVGKMFKLLAAHLPPLPSGVPSPLSWGDEPTVHSRMLPGFRVVRIARRTTLMCYPFPPTEMGEFFRQYFGPTRMAFAALDAPAQAAFRRDMIELQITHNVARTPDITEVAAEYLEVIAVRN